MSWNFTQVPHFQQPHQQHYVNQQQSQHYGSYGQQFQSAFQQNAWQAYSMSEEQQLSDLFTQYVSASPANSMANGIQSEDLCNILNKTPSIRKYYGINWSRELCSVLMAMLDRNPDGFMQWSEFNELQCCLLAWHRMFQQYDTDRSNYIEAEELAQVIKAFGYRINPDVMTTLLKRYSRAHAHCGQVRTLIAFDDFVSLCVRLRAYTDAFRKRDAQMHAGRETGNTEFSYDDFLRCVMCL